MSMTICYEVASHLVIYSRLATVTKHESRCSAALHRPKTPCTMSRHGCRAKDNDLNVDLSKTSVGMVLVGEDDPQSFGSA